MEFNFKSPPNRRFVLRLGGFALIFLVSLAVASYFLGNNLVDGPLVWVLAVMPGLAMVGMFYAYGMLIIEQDDEFIRMLVIRQLIIATGIALSFATIWGSLEHFGMVEHIYPYYVALVWFLGFAFGGLVNRITLGAWGEMS